jgi:aspartate aminotransferase
MGTFLDSVPLSAIVKIRDLMYQVKDPFRLDQGDVSFDAPTTFKQAVHKALDDNHTHYLPTAGLPRLRQLLTEKMQRKNGIPIGSPDEVQVTNGGTHAMYAAMHAVLEPGDEVILPDPEWPPTMAIVISTRAVPVAVPLHEHLGWRWDIDEVERAITPKTRALYINSPNNPAGGILTRGDIERLAAIARERNLWVFSDEAYEDMVFDGEHVSIASLPGMYERTIPLYTFSKTYAVTGVRMGYYAVKDPTVRARALKVVLYTTSNVSSLTQHGAIGALEGSQGCIDDYRSELKTRRDLFYDGITRSYGRR